MKRFILLFVLLGIHHWLLAGHTIVLDQDKTVQRVTRGFEVYEDQTGKLNAEQVSKQVFKPLDSDVANLSVTYSTIWCRAAITTTLKNDWYLEYLQPSIEIVECYIARNNDSQQKFISGINVPKNERAALGNHILFPLNISPGDTVKVLVKIRTFGPMTVNFEAGSLRAFFESDHSTNFTHGLYFGLIFIMVLYNLFLFFTNADRVYIYYVLYMCFTALFVSFFTGYVLIMPEFMGKFFANFAILVPTAFGVFSMIFSLHFLSTRTFIPRLHRVLVGFICLMAIPITVAFFDHRMGVMLVQTMGVLSPFLAISAGISVLRKGYRPAKFYLLGFGAFMLGLLVFIVTNSTGLGKHVITHYAFEIGSALEAVVLSFAIGDKLNIANKEREKAREEALAVLQQNEKLVREQNVVLEQKVKERTLELQTQKEIIEEKNKEITDSINYAKKIQYALLAQDQWMKQNLSEHFVFFQPKDIVSGDFYWATRKVSGLEWKVSNLASGTHHSKSETSNSKSETSNPPTDSFYLAVCDSTGHGVPGAFMSLLNISFLNEAITEKNITDPARVFDHIRKRLIENISQEGQKDGMDGILVKFHSAREGSDFNAQMEYAAANNVPILVRNGQIIELPFDKIPVGYSDRLKPFNTYTVELKKGDLLYLYTDGYADQFGGPKGKKFKYKNLNRLLVDHSAMDLNKQQKILQEQFQQWKGNLEQLDDILVIGIKI